MKFIYIFLFVFIFSCCKNKIDVSLDQWNLSMCCKNDSTKIKIINFDLEEGNQVKVFCCDGFYLNSRLQINLSHREEDGTYKNLFDLISDGKAEKEIIISLEKEPTGYKGLFIPHGILPNGFYRLHLMRGGSCGEVQFLVKNGKKMDEKYTCIGKCS